RDAVHDAIEELDHRERFIVEKRLMADPEDELSLAELGRQLGVSRERARQLEARAKKKLKGRLEALSRDDAGGSANATSPPKPAWPKEPPLQSHPMASS